jgi:hypothetical protein
MISDRDRTFTRSVWHELVKLSDTTPKSSYHSGLAGWRDGRALARGPAFPLPLPAAAGGAHAKRRDGCAARAGKDGRWRARRDWAGCCVSSVGAAARMDMHGWGSFQAWHLVSSRLAAFCRSCQQALLHATVTGRRAPTATRTDREREREREESSMPRHALAHVRNMACIEPQASRRSPSTAGCLWASVPLSLSLSLCTVSASSMIPFLSLSLSRTRPLASCLFNTRPSGSKRKENKIKSSCPCVVRLVAAGAP